VLLRNTIPRDNRRGAAYAARGCIIDSFPMIDRETVEHAVSHRAVAGALNLALGHSRIKHEPSPLQISARR